MKRYSVHSSILTLYKRNTTPHARAMPPPTPFIIYTKQDESGWVRYLPDSLDSENSDLARMTIEDLTLRSEKGNRQLCVISPKLALAVIKPERADERIKPGV